MSNSFSADRARQLDKTSEMQAESRCVEHPSSTSQTHLRIAAPVRVSVTDPARIRGILASLSAERTTGTIRVLDASLPVDELEGQGAAELAPGLCLLVSAGFRNVAKDCTWKVELQGPFSLVRFDLAPTDRKARGYFVVPVELECIYRRSERRVSAPPATVIRFLRQDCADVSCERTLRDLASGGLQFVAEADDHFCIGERLLSAEVTWKHGPRISIVAQVRHVTAIEGSTRSLCGLRICVVSDADAQAWHREVSSLLHPDTADAATVRPDQLWDLYSASGYFGLDGRNEDDYAHLKAAFDRISPILGVASDISCRVVREYRGRVEATIAMVRSWSGGWLACQIARQQERNPLVLSGNVVLRDMFLHAYETVQQHSSLRWHVTYVRRDARFSHLAYREFAIPRIDNISVAMVPFRAMQVSCAETPPIEPRPDLEIGLAEPCEVSLLMLALAGRFPAPYLEAYDFVPERFDLAEIQRDWQRGQLLRLRQVLVVRRNGRPMAAAILDMVEPGVHLVGLLDSVHLVELQPQGALEFLWLLQAVQRFYCEHGRREFILFEESGDPRSAILLGARDLGEADQIFVAGTLTPEFLDHVSGITAPRNMLVDA